MKGLQALRERKGLTQEALARLAHTSQPQIDRLEKGKRQLTVAWAKRLAPLVDAKPLDLLPPELQDQKSSLDTNKVRETADKQSYHGAVGDVLHKLLSNGEGDEMVTPGSILAAIGMLTVELAALREEVKELKAAKNDSNPKGASRK
jgi:transcriptional regulator with XRE-family HTH domain